RAPHATVSPPAFEFEEATIADLQKAMTSGAKTSRDLVHAYLERIERVDQDGAKLRSLIEVNREAESLAEKSDQERKDKGPRGPLHGIPVLIKDNIDTGDHMVTSAGSRAL